MSVILFGSYVNGTPHEWSDIDIAVIMNGFQGDWWKTASMLVGLKCDVSVDIEPHLMDISDDPSGFVRHIIETGEVIYSANPNQ
jgi:predicted nucleotidyltransferase